MSERKGKRSDKVVMEGMKSLENKLKLSAEQSNESFVRRANQYKKFAESRKDLKIVKEIVVDNKRTCEAHIRRTLDRRPELKFLKVRPFSYSGSNGAVVRPYI